MMERLRDLKLRQNYGYGDNLLRDFYIPALARAVRYDRAVAYFNSHSLAGAAAGLSHFIERGGTIRLMVSPHNWDEGDVQALHGNLTVPEQLAQRLAASLVPENEIQKDRLSVLAWLVQEQRLEARILVGARGQLYHQKIGILVDAAGDGVAFSGSSNETLSAWERNAELVPTFCTWKSREQRESFDFQVQQFERFWEGQTDFRALPFPKAVLDKLLQMAPASPPLHVDVEPDPPALELFPHQQAGVKQLVQAYPNSRLLADEVGLGKTVTAGRALMKLREQGKCKRVLILAPANVCVQWQEELREKFGFDCPRLDAGQVRYPDGNSERWSRDNSFNQYDILIASSHLVRRSDWKQRLENAEPYDLIILDEAHHARRTAPEINLKRGRHRRNQLLALLEDVLVPQACCLWLLTATPVQLHLVEFYDLLRVLVTDDEKIGSPLQDWESFESFYQALADPGSFQAWSKLGQGVQWIADYSVPARGLSPANRKRLERFGREGRDAAQDARNLCQAGYGDLLLQSLQDRSPGGRLMLRRTRQQADMSGLFAQRVPEKVEISFASREEEALYGELDDFLLRLRTRDTKSGSRGFGFLLTIYRKRLTSSWQAVAKTIGRALSQDDQAMDELTLLEQGMEPADWDYEGKFQKLHKDFTADDRKALKVFAGRVSRVVEEQQDPKIRQLHRDIDVCRARGISILLFTQFWDTLEYLRTFLQGRYGNQVACYSGRGGEIWKLGEWIPVPKELLIRDLNEGKITILLCTDAASEGLNLQAASTLINFDLPWNPMRVEQRIGRIDRIRQTSSHLHIRNYVMRDTIEDRVYEVLENRIKLFEGAVGHMQPILGRVENLMADVTPEEASSQLESLLTKHEGEGHKVSVALGGIV